MRPARPSANFRNNPQRGEGACALGLVQPAPRRTCYRPHERRVTAPVVIKLGGSYASSAQRDNWLDAIDRCAGQAILVPGGGPFADAVRTAQRELGFDDSAAHHMALLAMEQYGRALASGRPRFKLASSAEEIHHVLADGGVPVWAPARMVLAAKNLPES